MKTIPLLASLIIIPYAHAEYKTDMLSSHHNVILIDAAAGSDGGTGTRTAAPGPMCGPGENGGLGEMGQSGAVMVGRGGNGGAGANGGDGGNGGLGRKRWKMGGNGRRVDRTAMPEAMAGMGGNGSTGGDGGNGGTGGKWGAMVVMVARGGGGRERWEQGSGVMAVREVDVVTEEMVVTKLQRCLNNTLSWPEAQGTGEQQQ